ncbi:MAG: hypothetical protein IAI49_06695 [Candidatus Eremiobacteraeota bacterium]|nr:hypothetical protein [Candidatus Eremiobacteraeota bacterium]
MSRRPPPLRREIVRDTRPPWYWVLLQTIVLGAGAYVAAAFVFLSLRHVTTMPHGPIWDPSFQAPLLFVLVVVALGALAVPFFASGSSLALRIFCGFAAAFLVAFAASGTFGIDALDPNIPLRFFVRHVVVPFRKSIGS